MGEGAVTGTNGIPQGSTLAPGLWNVYTNGIIRELATVRLEKLKPAAVADDTLTVSTSWWLARESIQLYERWCANSGLTINRRKSGVMFFGFGGGKPPTEKELWGYPVVDKYRYLGGMLDNKLRTVVHMMHIARKIGFIQHKLTPVRLMKDLRLNVNLFRTLCLPLVRMGLLAACGTASATDRQNYFRFVRAKFKIFCFLPKCLPNRTVNLILGDVEAVAINL